MAQIVNFPVQGSIATAVQSDKSNLDNLGQQISQLVQHYNQLKQQLMADQSTTKAQVVALLEQRRADLQTLIDAHQAAIAALRQKAVQNNIAIDAQAPVMTLQGIGQLIDTSSIQAQITAQQSKLSSLQAYYAAYQSAIASGQQPPPLPPELSEGFAGISGTTIALLVGLVVGGWAFFKGK